MAEWVSQSEAVKLLDGLGDKISQPALSQYVTSHQEIERRAGGPGRPTMINWDQLKTSRLARRSRGPAETPTLELGSAPPVATEPQAAAAPERPRNEFGDRKALADVQRAEADARRSRILADEAEGLTVPRAVAEAAFAAAGVALVRTLEEQRRGVIDAVRSAREPRDADLAMRDYERKVRTNFAAALSDLAAASTSETPVAP